MSVLGLLLWGCGGGPELEIKSQWNDSVVVLDGIADDWAGFPLQYWEEKKISLGVRNDAENIYVLFLSREGDLARRIQMEGITLWLDTTGERRKEFGIRYRGSVGMMSLTEGSPVPQNISPEQRARFEEMRSEMGAMVTVMTKGEEIPIAEGNTKGPVAASATQDGSFGYEFKIPTVANDSVFCAIDTSPGETISLGLELGGLDPEYLEEMMRKSREMGVRGGGMKGELGRRMSGGVAPEGGYKGGIFKKQEMWIRIHLAENPDSTKTEESVPKQ